MSNLSILVPPASRQVNKSSEPLSLPGFDTLPEIEPQPKSSPAKVKYYLRILHKDRWYFLWKTHTNGGCEWESEPMGRKRPLFYKTYAGAKRQLWSYTYDLDVTERQVATWQPARADGSQEGGE